MPYRGWFALNGYEIANSSRAKAHMGGSVPTSDAGVWGTDPESCTPTAVSGHPLLFETPADQVPIDSGRLLFYPANGARKFSEALFDLDECYGSPQSCSSCLTQVTYDDTWPGLRTFLDDSEYRPELAPWYTTQLPESGEFGGVWVLDVKGLDTTPVQRGITQAVGDGGIAGPHRDTPRTVAFTALLIACSNAGVEYGLQWLTCLLRDTNDNVTSRLRYLKASPFGSGVDPASLVREVNGVVMTKEPSVDQRFVSGGAQNRHGNMYQVTWEMTTLSPYVYLPSIDVTVAWDQITRQPINWVHGADCSKPEDCSDLPILYAAGCEPEIVTRVTTPPPVCGGCLPVSAIDKYSFRVPTMDYAFRCRETSVTLSIKNTAKTDLTCQAFWRICGSDTRCEDNQFPLQITSLPAGATLYLDGITGSYKVWYEKRWRLPMGMVGTPQGSPWMPPLIDRETCWEFIIQSASSASFDVSMVLADREA